MSWASRKYGTDYEGHCDMQAEARELHYDALWDAARGAQESDECDACFHTVCVCPTLPLDEDAPERPATYGMCTGCGSVEVRLNNVTGHRDLSDIGEHERYPTGYGCEVCS